MNFKGAIQQKLMQFRRNNGNICTIQTTIYCSITRFSQLSFCKESLLGNISFINFSYLILILSQKTLHFLNQEGEEWETLTQSNCIQTIRTKPKIHKEQSHELIQVSVLSILAAEIKHTALAKRLMITIKVCNSMLLKSFQQAHLGQT